MSYDSFQFSYTDILYYRVPTIISFVLDVLLFEPYHIKKRDPRIRRMKVYYPVLKCQIFGIGCEFLFHRSRREKDDLGCCYLEGELFGKRFSTTNPNF